MLSNEIKNVPNNIIKSLQNIKGIQGILFTGSRTTKTFSLNSDWDFIILLSDNQKGYRKTYKIDKELVEIFCHPKKELIEFFKIDPVNRIGATTHMLSSGIILKDDKKILASIIKQAKNIWEKGPRSIEKSEFQWVGYDISTYIQDVEDCLKNNNPAFLLFYQAINEMVKYYYALSGVWLPLPKKRLDDLKKRKPDIYKIVIKFSKTSNWQQKAKIIINFGKLLSKHFNLNINGELLKQKS